MKAIAARVAETAGGPQGKFMGESQQSLHELVKGPPVCSGSVPCELVRFMVEASGIRKLGLSVDWAFTVATLQESAMRKVRGLLHYRQQPESESLADYVHDISSICEFVISRCGLGTCFQLYYDRIEPTD